MQLRTLHIVVIVLLMIVLHFLANAIGLYEGDIIWIDKALHVLGGIALAMGWILFREQQHAPVTVLSMLLVVLAGALLWEIVELAFLVTFPSYAHTLNLFSPTVQDAATDVLANVLGGTVMIFLQRKAYVQ